MHEQRLAGKRAAAIAWVVMLLAIPLTSLFLDGRTARQYDIPLWGAYTASAYGFLAILIAFIHPTPRKHGVRVPIALLGVGLCVAGYGALVSAYSAVGQNAWSGKLVITGGMVSFLSFIWASFSVKVVDPASEQK
jgi:hypothetical protein